MAHLSYTPEMGQEKPAAPIQATMSHYGKHYFLDTHLTLKGRGVQDLGRGERRGVMVNRYKVTINAYAKICQAHDVSYEALLD